MAHFALLDDNNTVLQVIVVGNEYLLDGEVEKEERGVQFCIDTFGGGIWKQTSYNNNFRKEYARVGGTYDPLHDVFIRPKPYPSWVLDSNFNWVAPIPYPGIMGGDFVWNETSQTWDPHNVWEHAERAPGLK